jgi:hypothetical protein
MKILVTLAKMIVLGGLAVLNAWGPVISQAVKNAILPFMIP